MSHDTSQPSRTYEPATTGESRSRFSLYLGLEVLLAALVALSVLGRSGLWLDEAFSVDFTSGSWSRLFGVIAEREAMHGFYYVVLKAWSSVAGTSELAVRLPSVLFFVVAVWALAILGRLLFTDRIGLIAGLLLIVNPFLLVFAREARSYAMVTALVTVATLLFVILLDSDRTDVHLLAGYTIAGTLAVYTHTYGRFSWSPFMPVHCCSSVIGDEWLVGSRGAGCSWRLSPALCCTSSSS